MDFNVLSLVYVITALLIGMTLHEFAHAFMGHWLGDNTARQEGRLTINPLAHIDPVLTILLPTLLLIAGLPVIAAAKPVPFNPWAVRFGRWGAALVAVAGPIMNFIIAAIFAAVLALGAAFLTPNIVQFFVLVITINVFLGVFNLLPIPPLDGSRVVYAAVPPIRDLYDQIERYGLIVIMVIFLLGARYIGGVISAISDPIIQFLIPGLSGSPF